MLSVSENERTGDVPNKYVEYKLYDPRVSQDAITYLRNYPDPGPGGYPAGYNSTWAVFGYESEDDLINGTLTLYKSYQQFYQVEGEQVGTPPVKKARKEEEEKDEDEDEGERISQDELWNRAIRRQRPPAGGGRRRKTRHRRRKTHRRKTRRSRR